MKSVTALMKALGSSVRRLSAPGASGFRDGWLFAAASRSVLIVEQHSGVVVEANPAAANLLDIERIHLIGSPLAQLFSESSAALLTQNLAVAQASGHARPVALHTRRGNAELSVTLSVVRSGSDSYLLVRLSTPALEGRQQGTDEAPSIVLDIIADSHEGFVLTDLVLRVTYANPAFAALVGVNSIHELLGKSLAQWLELSQADLTRLREQMSSREAAETWMTTLRQAIGSLMPVEITAVAVPDGEDACWGFRIALPAPGNSRHPSGSRL